MHCDSRNDSLPNMVCALSDFEGGEVWVQDPQGDHILDVNGIDTPGVLLDPKAFSRHSVCPMPPWGGKDLA